MEPLEQKRTSVNGADNVHPNKRLKKNSIQYRMDNQPQRESNNQSLSSNTSINNSTQRNFSHTPRIYTVSIALPGSSIANMQSLELKTYVAGQIARALTMFKIDEVIVYNATSAPLSPDPMRDANVFLGKILQYLECPQYLRKSFFPHQPALKFAGLLSSLDAPHHVRIDEFSPYREGVVADKPSKKTGAGSVVNVGMRKEITIDRTLKPGVRVTIALTKESINAKIPIGKVVSPNAPQCEAGLYWGYQVRIAEGLADVFGNCPYQGGYDLKIGTSDRGSDLANNIATLPSFSHMLVVFGGPGGIETAIDTDQSLSVAAEDAHTLFDLWVNSCPNQGSRTTRTEENIMITMSLLRPAIQAKGA